MFFSQYLFEFGRMPRHGLSSQGSKQSSAIIQSVLDCQSPNKRLLQREIVKEKQTFSTIKVLCQLEIINILCLLGNESNTAMKLLDAEMIFIRAAVCLVSLTGCLWHLMDISNIYFSYATNVNVDFERNPVVEIPGVTICTNVSLAINQGYMRSKYSREMTANQVCGVNDVR